MSNESNNLHLFKNIQKISGRMAEYQHYYRLIYPEIQSANKLTDIPRTHKDIFNTPPDSEFAHYRYSSASFETEESGGLVPQPFDFLWETLEHVVKRDRPHAVALIVPPWWQIEPMFSHTVATHGLPTVALQPQNIPAAAEIIRQVGVNSVVTTGPVANKLYSALKPKKLHHLISSWSLIVPVEQNENFTFSPSHGIVFREFHFLPGYILGYQCLPLAEQNSENAFHLSDNFLFEIENESVLVTSQDTRSFPFIRYEIKQSIVEGEKCLCGKKIMHA